MLYAEDGAGPLAHFADPIPGVRLNSLVRAAAVPVAGSVRVFRPGAIRVGPASGFRTGRSGLAHLDAAVQLRALFHHDNRTVEIAIHNRGLVQNDLLRRDDVALDQTTDDNADRVNGRHDLAGLTHDQRVVTRDLATERAVDSDRIFERELAHELRALIDERGQIAEATAGARARRAARAGSGCRRRTFFASTESEVNFS